MPVHTTSHKATVHQFWICGKLRHCCSRKTTGREEQSFHPFRVSSRTTDWFVTPVLDGCLYYSMLCHSHKVFIFVYNLHAFVFIKYLLFLTVSTWMTDFYPLPNPYPIPYSPHPYSEMTLQTLLVTTRVNCITSMPRDFKNLSSMCCYQHLTISPLQFARLTCQYTWCTN